MVPTRNLTAEQLHEPHPNFLRKPHFDLDRKNLSKSPMVVANSVDVEETKDKEEKEEVGRNPNPKDWLRLGVTSNQEIRKSDPIELELFTDRLSCQAQKQMIGTSKRHRHAMLEQLGRSSWHPVNGGEFRVVTPPRRPEAGVWLVLSAARNQLKEPLLPQIERSYLRIKDCNMTVRLLMNYLANKLGLRNESEVEICCKGQSLPPFLMLQYVRDNIWRSKEASELPPRVATTDHVMSLNYRRRRLSG